MEKLGQPPREFLNAVNHLDTFRKGRRILIEGMTGDQYLEYMGEVFPDLLLSRAALYHASSRKLEVAETVFEDHGYIYERVKLPVARWCEEHNESPTDHRQFVSGQTFPYGNRRFFKIDQWPMLPISETFRPLAEQGYMVLDPDYQPLPNLPVGKSS